MIQGLKSLYMSNIHSYKKPDAFQSYSSLACVEPLHLEVEAMCHGASACYGRSVHALFASLAMGAEGGVFILSSPLSLNSHRLHLLIDFD